MLKEKLLTKEDFEHYAKTNYSYFLELAKKYENDSDYYMEHVLPIYKKYAYKNDFGKGYEIRHEKKSITFGGIMKFFLGLMAFAVLAIILQRFYQQEKMKEEMLKVARNPFALLQEWAKNYDSINYNEDEMAELHLKNSFTALELLIDQDPSLSYLVLLKDYRFKSIDDALRKDYKVTRTILPNKQFTHTWTNEKLRLEVTNDINNEDAGVYEITVKMNMISSKEIFKVNIVKKTVTKYATKED